MASCSIKHIKLAFGDNANHLRFLIDSLKEDVS